MNTKFKLLLLSIVLLSFTNSFSQQKKPENFKSTLKFGGRIMFDYGFNKLNNEKHAGSEFRRLRGFVKGKVAENVAYKMQIDFSKGHAVINDAYIKFIKLPKIGGTFMVGNFKEPTSLNILTSSKYNTFVEYATLVNFHQARNTGVMYNTNFLNNKLSFQIAYNTNSNSFGKDEKINEGQNFTVRFTGLAINNKEKHQLLHLGTSFSNRVPSKNDTGIRTYKVGIRPESHLATKAISNTFTDVNNINLNGFEFAFISGSFSLQSEYTTANINTQSKNFSASSYYAFVSYFLTKEHRSYKSSYGGFSRVKPLHNFDNNHGWGAFELAIRFSSFDLSDVSQGTLNDLTFGLNWYLNPRTRIMYNYVNAKNTFKALKNNAHLIRFQLDF